MNIIHFNELNSTNTYLKENHYKYSDKTVIHAIKQTNGRGRFDRVWESGNDLTFSILFKNINVNHHLIAPLAIVKALQSFNIESRIKWPNDIYINGKKVSGILIESIYQNNEKKCDIVGIGINTTKKDEALNATYINVDNNILLEKIVKSYEELINVNPQFLLSLYSSLSYVLGKKVLYKNEEYEIMAFSENLELILSNTNNTIKVLANEIDIKTSIIKY